MAAYSQHVLRVCDVGGDYEYDIEVASAERTYLAVKKVLRNMSKRLTNKQSRSMFRTAVMRNVAEKVLAEGSTVGQCGSATCWHGRRRRKASKKPFW